MGDSLVAIRMKYAEDIEDILQCPVCWEQPLGPIMTCTTGHHICEKCYRTVRMCPTCKQGYTGSRNYVAEALSESFEQMKTSILDPRHHINRKILQNKKCVHTQTIFDVKVAETQTVSNTSSVCIQTEFSEVSATTQTDFSGVSIETQTGDPELQIDVSSLLINEDESITVPCFLRTCKFKSPCMQIISHITRCHKKNLLKISASCKDFYSKTFYFLYKINTSYDYAITIHDGGLFFFNILIDQEGNLHGNIEVIINSRKEQQFYYNIFVPNEKKPLQSEFFKGIVSNYYEIGTTCNGNIFISNSLFSRGLLKKNKSFECSLSLHRPEDC